MSNEALSRTADMGSVFTEEESSNPFFRKATGKDVSHLTLVEPNGGTGLSPQHEPVSNTSLSRNIMSTGSDSFVDPERDQTLQGRNAYNIKETNRQLVRQTLLPKEGELIAERTMLVKKKYREGISKGESTKLRYIEWQLDRIEDAIGGESIDYLESLVEAQENLAQTVAKWGSVVSQHIPSGSHRNRRRS